MINHFTTLKSFSKKLFFTGLICLSGFSLFAQIGPVAGVFTTCSETFTDPGGAGNYENNSNVIYTIQPNDPVTQVTTVIFSSFSIENDYDLLVVYDGNSTSAQVIGTYTSTNSPGAISASQNNASGALTFHFTSDFIVQGIGWDATVTCTDRSLAPVRNVINRPGTYYGCDFDISDPGGPTTNSQHNENVVMTFCPILETERIHISFSSFSLENNFDYLRIYNGPGTSSLLIATLTGSALPQDYTASAANTSGCLTVQYTSDGSVPSAGYNATISCVIVDGCPDDPEKTEPGACECGVPDTDTDGDDVADCIDACPNDAANDADGDGLCADADNCPATSNADQADLDADGTGDVCDTDMDGDDVPNAYDCDPMDATQDKWLVCHNGRTICIAGSAIQAHVNHGDPLGPCESAGSRIDIDNFAHGAETESMFHISNYPNPFSQSTRIEYEVPVDSRISITVFDALGRKVSTLIDAEQPAGIYAVEFNANDITKGLYYYTLTATYNGKVEIQTRKMTVID